MKAVLSLLLLPLLLLIAGCAANRQVATGPVVPCPAVYNGCYGD